MQPRDLPNPGKDLGKIELMSLYLPVPGYPAGQPEMAPQIEPGDRPHDAKEQTAPSGGEGPPGAYSGKNNRAEGMRQREKGEQSGDRTEEGSQEQYLTS